MFIPGLTSEARISIAKSLQGNSVVALAQDCARASDLEGLEALRLAGHFDFPFELAHKPCDSWKIQHAQQLKDRALPMIDALVCALESKETRQESYATPHSGDKSIVNATITRVATNRPLWSFISHICTSALDQFDELFESTPANTIQDAIGQNRIRTANVVAFIAAGSNDAELYARAQRSYSDAGRRLHEGPALNYIIGEQANLSKISAQGVAVAMGSLDVLTAHVGGGQVRQTMAKKRSGDFEVTAGLDYLLAASTGGLYVGVPQPGLVLWMLNASLDEEYEPTPTSTNAGKHQLNKALWAQQLFSGSWSHCVKDVMAKHPRYVNEMRTEAFIFSVRSGFNGVAEQLLSDWATLRNPPVQEDGVCVWGDHPIKSIIPSRMHHGHIGDIETRDIDAAVVFMAKYMDDEQLLDPFISGQVKLFPDTALVHAIAQHNLNSSLVYFAEKGLDLEALSGGRTAAEIIEFVESTKTSDDDTSDNAETLRLLRALSARRAAVDALSHVSSARP